MTIWLVLRCVMTVSRERDMRDARRLYGVVVDSPNDRP